MEWAQWYFELDPGFYQSVIEMDLPDLPDYWIKAWLISGLIWLYIYGIIQVVLDLIRGNTLEDVDNTEADDETKHDLR